MATHIRAGEAPTKDIKRAEWQAGERGTRYMLVHPGIGSERMHMNMQILVPRGVVGPYHIHPNADSAYYILSGSATMLLEDVETEVGTGDAIYIPAGERHAIINTSDEELKFLEFRSPPDRTLIEVPRTDGRTVGRRP